MVITLLVFTHLIATCAAIGTIVLTDLRLIARAMGYRVVIPPPERLETRIVTVALMVLYLTGVALVAAGVQGASDYLTNPKLQAKLALVVLLTLNAFILHLWVFPILGRARTVSRWKRRDRLVVAASVSLSNSLWFYCAFLGVARLWNGTVSLGFVLLVALMVWAVTLLMAHVLLVVASRDAPQVRPDWIDSMKASISDFSALRDR
ncbi:hypothetical protein [Hydrogenophaga sp.]|uniref:hypothetical protein n=1 Tax=Hydrogenophaga sp. TaxID=1904254 RepID=UPI002717F730|nr:hypothetical protein [Hydrogenophaga sp.]MDO9435679.1 hypothetical protein [Hydrogenophaga sp.]